MEAGRLWARWGRRWEGGGEVEVGGCGGRGGRREEGGEVVKENRGEGGAAEDGVCLFMCRCGGRE